MVGFNVELNFVSEEVLYDDRYELCDNVGVGGVDVGGAAVAAVHDEGALFILALDVTMNRL
jgi:hypothetical protein